MLSSHLMAVMAAHRRINVRACVTSEEEKHKELKAKDKNKCNEVDNKDARVLSSDTEGGK